MPEINIDLLPYQEEIFFSPAKRLAMVAGTGTGKTFFIPRFLLCRMAQTQGYDWVVSSPTIPMLKRNPIKYIFRFLQECGYQECFRKTNLKSWQYHWNSTDMELIFATGQVHFISAETPERMQGLHIKGIIGDEAGGFPRAWYDTAVQRLAFHSGVLLLTTTWYELNWLDDEIYQKWLNGDKDFHCVCPKSSDNPYYPPEEIERARRDLPDKLFRMMYMAERPGSGVNNLFDGRDIRACFGRVVPDGEAVITFDVSNDGDDSSVILLWKGYKNIEK